MHDKFRTHLKALYQTTCDDEDVEIVAALNL